MTKVPSQKTPLSLYAWFLASPESPRLIGEIIKQNNGDVGLAYAPSWLMDGFALSDDLPLMGEIFTPIHRMGRQAAAPGALDDARPDRWGEKVIRYLYKPAATLFENLYFAGDERFGAIGVSGSQASYQAFMPRALPRFTDASDLVDALKIIAADDNQLTEQQRMLVGAGGSLGGAKPKAVIAIDGVEHVLKISGGEPFNHPLVEYATMTLARQCGINVANVQLIALPTEHALAVQRFDRNDGQRIHCISACTLLRSETPQGLDPDFGYPHLARAMRRVANPKTLSAQLLELFRRMVFNILVANTDDHEKNHAFLCHSKGRTVALELSSAFDIVPTGSGALEHQFLISDTSRQPLLSNAMQVASDFELSQTQGAQQIAKIMSVVDGWKAHFLACGVTASDVEQIAALIDSKELMAQRARFKVSDFPDGVLKTKRIKGGAAAFK